MRKLLIGLVAFGTISAFAHPMESDDFYKVGVGSQITVIQDLNVPPHSTQITLGSVLKGKQYDSQGKLRGQRTFVCKLNLAEPKPFDRVLRVGNVTITQTEQIVKYLRTDTTSGWLSDGRSYGEWYTKVFQTIDKITTDNASIGSIECFNSNGDTKNDPQAVTIGDFKKISEGKLGIKLAKPEDL